MRTFRDMPIRQKLVTMIMVNTMAALLIAGCGIVLADSILFRHSLQRDIAALSRIVADNSTAALSFDDPKSAAETLGALRARTHVTGACIYRADTTVLARYGRESAFQCPPASRAYSSEFTGGQLVATQPVMLAGRRIGTLTLVYDMDELRERAILYGTTVLGVLLVSSLLAFLLSSRLRELIAAPISQLARVATSVAVTGNYGFRAEKLSGDEMGLLVDRFNEMLAGIQSRDNHLRAALVDREAALREAEEERERFHFMAESMPQKIFTANARGEVDYFNRQWIDFTGLSFEAITNWTEYVHPDDLEANVQAWRESIETGEPFHFEHRFRRADGEYRWHLSRARAMRDANGNIVMWIGSSTEIHEQKEKEAELRRANDDLQQFAYSASHDLQEPIRNVAVYSELVARRYHDLLDPDGRQFLGFLSEGGHRLATLISDLLAYTRAGTTELEAAKVDSGAILRQSLDGLAEALRESNATVTWDALPEVYVSAAHLQQLFQNLVGNALKYRAAESPRIHVSAALRGAAWCFSIQDNGIGIDPQYKEKIFGVFKRLHHDRKYSGTGIGLAICQRVVERYGGRIWVESEPGKGSTFRFTVPRHAESFRKAAAESAAG